MWMIVWKISFLRFVPCWGSKNIFQAPKSQEKLVPHLLKSFCVHEMHLNLTKINFLQSMVFAFSWNSQNLQKILSQMVNFDRIDVKRKILQIWPILNFTQTPLRAKTRKKYSFRQSSTEYIETMHQNGIISHYVRHFKVTFYGVNGCKGQISIFPRTVPIISRYLPTSTGFDLRPKVLSLKSKSHR